MRDVLAPAAGRRGAVLFLTIFWLFILAGVAMAVGVFAHNAMAGARTQLLDKQAYYVAEAGLQRARQAITAGTWAATPSPGAVQTEMFGAGEYRVTMIDNLNSTYTITAEGYVPSQANPAIQRRLMEASAPISTSGTGNLSLTATASASSSGGSNTPSKAIDGNLDTSWKASNKGNAWLALDFGSALTLNKIVVEEDSNMTSVSIEWSDDNATWTTANGLSVVESPSQTWTCTFTPAMHRYFRAAISAASNKKPGVNEMESYNTTGSTITFTGKGQTTTQW